MYIWYKPLAILLSTYQKLLKLMDIRRSSDTNSLCSFLRHGVYVSRNVCICVCARVRECMYVRVSVCFFSILLLLFVPATVSVYMMLFGGRNSDNTLSSSDQLCTIFERDAITSYIRNTRFLIGRIPRRISLSISLSLSLSLTLSLSLSLSLSFSLFVYVCLCLRPCF